ncbi:hypothetical protein [Sphingomonas sp. BK235]|uniref:hypothetical protein n=1 Tax=Sphingomonas sp. BK235 TaxID=2512131 RepID=UPI00104D8412|nr:hypothetical protein [Sphingomonas sp. BK235]TCP33244.1 hypothetical protein EV292_106186 [Sphingomonas sp. BK235]
MKTNPGFLPQEAIGRRVRVRLERDPAGVAPHEWPADGKMGCRWTRTGHPFDIAEYEVIG